MRKGYLMSCSCTCHGFAPPHIPPCSVLGGCGHLHTASRLLCVLPHRDDAEHEQHVGLLCRWHRNRLDLIVGEVATNLPLLLMIQVAGSAPKDSAPKTRHMKSSSPPAPANLDVLTLLDKRTSSVQYPQLLESDGLPADMSRPGTPVLAVIASWVLLVADERPLTTQLPSSALGQLDLLRRHHDWIAAQPWVDDYLTEMTELKRAMSTALRDNTHRFMGRCYLIGEDGQVCNGELLQENGTEFVQCRKARSHQWRTPRELAALEYGLTQARTA
jgi:hypothetical protein